MSCNRYILLATFRLPEDAVICGAEANVSALQDVVQWTERFESIAPSQRERFRRAGENAARRRAATGISNATPSAHRSFCAHSQECLRWESWSSGSENSNLLASGVAGRRASGGGEGHSCSNEMLRSRVRRAAPGKPIGLTRKSQGFFRFGHGHGAGPVEVGPTTMPCSVIATRRIAAMLLPGMPRMLREQAWVPHPAVGWEPRAGTGTARLVR